MRLSLAPFYHALVHFHSILNAKQALHHLEFALVPFVQHRQRLMDAQRAPLLLAQPAAQTIVRTCRAVVVLVRLVVLVAAVHVLEIGLGRFLVARVIDA